MVARNKTYQSAVITRSHVLVGGDKYFMKALSTSRVTW